MSCGTSTGMATSHHALAMQTANDASVLGNFKDAQFTKDGVTSSFFKKDSKFYVHTEGPDGKPQDYASLHIRGLAFATVPGSHFPTADCRALLWHGIRAASKRTGSAGSISIQAKQ